ncbi:hypothetical protein [Hyphomonas sp.]|uniref:hypothetical protein n=1 Tax=Hyphomonas sp. TaxID=87 RepID=UPI00333F7DAB
MNPYSRFRLVSSTASAAIIVAGLCAFGRPLLTAVADAAGPGTGLWIALGGAVTVLVVFWLALTEAIFPSLFRFDAVRRAILGKYYIEGTWLQAERGTAGGHRLAVIDIQPSGRTFIFSGYALNKDLEIESNTLIEFSKFEWPFMTYKYRNSLSDGADGQRECVGEIQFEMNRSAATRFNGYVQYVKAARRIKIEGAKLTKNSEVKRLRSLESRKVVLEKYWSLFFKTSLNTSLNTGAAAVQPAAARPVIVETTRAVVAERRQAASASTESKVVPRRRASDWRAEDTTPTADRIRAKIEAEEIEDEDVYEEEFEDEAELDAEIEVDAADEQDEAIMEDNPGQETAEVADEENDDEPAIRRRGRPAAR